LDRCAAGRRGLRGPPVWRLTSPTGSAPNSGIRPIQWDGQVAPMSHARELLREHRIGNREIALAHWLRWTPATSRLTPVVAGIRRYRAEHAAVQRLWREALCHRGIADRFAGHACLRCIGPGTVPVRSAANPTSDSRIRGTSLSRRDTELVALPLLTRVSNETLSFSVSRQPLPG